MHHSIEQENGTMCRALSLCLTWMLKIKYHLTVIFLALVYIYGSYFRRLLYRRIHLNDKNARECKFKDVPTYL